MIYQIVSVRDAAVGSFGRPIFCMSKGQGLRSFRDEVNRKDSEMSAHPEDYDLYFLGRFDDQNGQFETLTMPELVARGADVKEGNSRV